MFYNIELCNHRQPLILNIEQFITYDKNYLNHSNFCFNLTILQVNYFLTHSNRFDNLTYIQ